MCAFTDVGILKNSLPFTARVLEATEVVVTTNFAKSAEAIVSYIDYNYFSEDLLADRVFLDRYQGQHIKDGELQCLLVRYLNQMDRI